MSLYLIGDIQGCDDALQRLLEKCDFSPSRDTIYLLGDLVNRGPDSLGVLRRLMRLEAAAHCLLGNHDLHLLALAHGIRKPHRGDTLAPIMDAPDREAMLNWLVRQRLAMLENFHGRDVLMVHAGVVPSWSAQKTVALAREVESVLAGDDLVDFLKQMYGNEPAGWSDDLTGTARLRTIVNILTRMRFCNANDVMEFHAKEGADAAPPGFTPWFDLPGRQTANMTVAFGHWSTLGWLSRPNVWSLDTGCVWGGSLSAMRVHEACTGPYLTGDLIQISCT